MNVVDLNSKLLLKFYLNVKENVIFFKIGFFVNLNFLKFLKYLKIKNGNSFSIKSGKIEAPHNKIR
jgi:hypothetical protein